MKLMIATPMYGEMCGRAYVNSLMQVAAELHQRGITASLQSVGNDSLVPRARNKQAHAFMRGDYTHLLFWDADLAVVEPADLLNMLHFGQQKEYGVIGAPYAKKGVNWKAVAAAAREAEAGVSLEVLAEKLRYAGSEYVATVDKVAVLDRVQPVEAVDVGTGLMLIKREVFEQVQQGFPELWYTPMPGDGADGAEQMFAYFESRIAYVKEDGKLMLRYLSEDYLFCERVRSVGELVWVAPWIRTRHVGSYSYPGDMLREYRKGGR